MPRVKSGVAHHARKKKIMEAAKGARGGRSKLYKAAKETADAREIGGADEIALLQPILPLARLLGQDVRVIGVPALQLASSRSLEALHGCPFGFLLWHVAPVSCGVPLRPLRPLRPISARSPSSCCGPRAWPRTRFYPRPPDSRPPGRARPFPTPDGPFAGPGTSS